MHTWEQFNALAVMTRLELGELSPDEENLIGALERTYWDTLREQPLATIDGDPLLAAMRTLVQGGRPPEQVMELAWTWNEHIAAAIEADGVYSTAGWEPITYALSCALTAALRF